MKNSILTIAIFVTTLISSLQLTAQEFKSLDKSPMDMAAFPSNIQSPSIKRKRFSEISTPRKDLENWSK